MEFLFDARALSYFGAWVGVGAALLMVFFALRLHGREWGFVLWTWAFVFIALGQIFGAIRLLLGLSLTGGFANLCFLVGTVLLVRGVRFFAGATMRWRWHMAILVLAAVITVGTAWWNWQEVLRPVSFAIFEGVLMLELLWLLLRCMPPMLRGAGYFLAAMALVYLCLFGAIGWATAQLANQANKLFAVQVLTVGFIAACVALFLTAGGCVYMQTRSLKSRAQ